MVRIQEPFHGAVLNHRHGRQTPEGLEITVRGLAPVGERVTVNGRPARRAGERFEAPLLLQARETEIAALAEGATGRTEHRVRVLWDRHSRPRYRFSIDDNVYFLRDIHQAKTRSLFDCFYLRILRDLHAKYGTKFSLNLFYTTVEGDFNLSQFPASYKKEWEDNADWLKLAFHSYAENPDRPYQNATPEKLAADYDLVAAEVHRFAGEKSWALPTVIHWGMVHPSAMHVLVERGVRALSGFFVPNVGGRYTTDGELFTDPAVGYDVNYSLDDVRSEYLTRHDALKDFRTGIVFSKADIVCNNVPLDQVVPTLEPLTTNPDTAEIMDLFTHEQYFWRNYQHYRPDHAERCEAAIRFCVERGYEPIFLHEGFLGGPE